jgi:MFS family permease
MSLALGHLWADPFLKRTLLWLMAASLFGWSAQSQMAAFAKRHLGLGAMGYGSLVALNGLGAATAAFWIAARHGGRRPGRQMAAGLALLCASMLLLGMAGTWAWAAPLLLLNGAGMILFFSSGNTSLQARVPHHLRGRAMGVWAFIFGGAMPIGALLLGLFAERWGSARAIQASGAACALMTAAVWLGVPVKEQG